MKVQTTWRSEQHFSSSQEGQTIEVDGEKNKGMSPKALLLAAIAACSGIDIVEILGKMKVPFSDFSVDVESEQTEEHPRVFKDIHILYKMKTPKTNEEKVRKAIGLSLDKYCGVSAMLKKNSVVHYDLELQ